MEIGLIHLHKSLAHLLVFTAFVSLDLAVLGAGKKPNLANIMAKLNKFGVLMLGRLIYVAGLAVTIVGGYPIVQLWLLMGLVLWGAVEVAAKRLVASELDGVLGGGAGSAKPLAGAAIQLLVIVLIYGSMQMRISF